MDRKLQGILRVLIVLSAAAAILFAILVAVPAVIRYRLMALPTWAEKDRAHIDGCPDELHSILPVGSILQDAVCFDINGDGADEYVLLVWKRGSYGEHRPTWVEQDEKTLSQHIFIYAKEEEEDGAWRPLWMSSRTGIEAVRIAAGEEIPGTGRRSLDITHPDGSVSRWGWLSWGLLKI